MRIALFHNRYKVPGGEDVVVDREEAALQALGAEVFRYELDNGVVLARPGAGAIHSLLSAHFNRRRMGQVARFLKDVRADVGHVHNWFPLFSPSIYSAHAAAGVPVVQTLHNYRLGCASGTLTREGALCTLCLEGTRKPALEHRCYRNSATFTRLWSRVMDHGWRTGVLHKDVDLFLAPTRSVADVHVGLGLPKDKIRVLAHGVPDPGELPAPDAGAGALFVGRLSEEKGVGTLLDAWSNLDVPLTIAGSGPLEPAVLEAAERYPSIRFVGPQPPQEIVRLMGESAFLVSPHIAPETFGLAVVEAMAACRAVIASDVGGPSTILEDQVTGRLVPAGDPAALRQAVLELFAAKANTASMGQAARRAYLAQFTESVNGQALMGVFQELLVPSPRAQAA